MRSPTSRSLSVAACAGAFLVAAACGGFKNDKAGGGSGGGPDGSSSGSPGDGSSGGQDGSSGGCQGTSCVQTLVLFGGDEGAVVTPTQDTWTSDGSTWANFTTKHAPSHREQAAIAMLGGKAVLFSGSPTGQGDTVGETWTWDGTDWTLLHPAHSPGARSDAAVTSVGGVVLLYGGTDGANLLSDTWTWNGSDWTQHVGAGPGPRVGSMMAALAGEAVLFGGQGGTDGNTKLADTWVWSGSSWAAKSTAHAPSARSDGVAATVGNAIVLFSGIDTNAGSPPDTWTWDGSDWTQPPLTPAQSPPGRYGASFGVLGAQLYVFGGAAQPSGNPMLDTWVWTGTAWITGAASGPSARAYAAMTGPG